MATLSSTIELYDRISAPINNIIGALNNMVGIFESVDSTMDKGFDPSTIDATRRAIDLASQEVRVLDEEMKKYSQSTKTSKVETDNLVNSITKMAGAYMSFQGAKKLVDLSDTYVQTTARLGLIVKKEEDVKVLQDKIYQSAQRSRGSYQDMASSVAKLGLVAGKAFSGTDEIIKFTETLNKNFIVGGASATEQASAMYQLTQAMGSGRLQGDEYRSIIENAPLLAKSIEEYMVNVKGATGTMKEWASEGLLTAEVIKAALFKSADDVEKKFNKMPMTWSQVWTGFMNEIYMVSIPVLKVISFLAQNWSILKPIVIGLGVVVGSYTAALLVNKGVQLANTIATTLGAIAAVAHGKATAAQAAATTGMTAAQIKFNATLYACPLTWILILIVAVIAAVYAVIAVINKVTKKTISATGVIAGSIATVIAFIWNQVRGLVDFVLSGLQLIAKGIDALFGTNLAITVQGWRDALPDRWAYGDAYNSGYTWGENLGNKFSGDSVLDDIANTADNTEKIADSLDITNEDLKYLKDLAEQEVVNRFTTAEIKVDMTNNNSISNNMDLDGIVEYLVVGVNEAMEKAAEGV